MAGNRKESILDLRLLVDKEVHVKLAGGYDQLLNLVLDQCKEFLPGAHGSYRASHVAVYTLTM
jgi:small nuclear ribonucleoprotein (snRNP)-like protein